MKNKTSIINPENGETSNPIEQRLYEAHREIEKLRGALKEFDNDDNWLIVPQYIDRKTQSGWTDMVYIGKWDPRVFSNYALKGEPLPNTQPNERRTLSNAYDPDKAVTDLVQRLTKERDDYKAMVDRIVAERMKP